MKKLLSILALALCFVACQNEPNIGAKNSDLANVVLNIEAPELAATRADGDANTGKNSAFGAIDFFNDADWANYDVRYILEVYDVNDNGTGEPIYRERLVKYLEKYAPTTFELRLIPNRDYKFVVFADFVEQGSKDDLYYDTTDLRNITAKTGVEGWNAMNEVRDAYFVSENVEISTSGTKTLTLKRPFGKVRVIATDLDYIAGYSKPGYVEVKYHTEALFKSFNAVNGNLNDTVLAGTELTYAYEVKKDAPYTEGYDAEAKNQTLFADYLFAREGQQIPVNFKMAVYESKGGRLIKETDFNTQIPVQRNHLTTIIGDVLTTEANITIVVNDDFVEQMINPSMEVAPAAPAVTATVEGNTVTLKWDEVEGAAKYFVRNANTETSFEETTELTKVYENLEWETEYSFEVYAMNEKGLVSETTTVKATTEKAPVVVTYDIYLENADNWETCYFYAWGEYKTAEWPGDQMTKTTIGETEYYVYSLSAENYGKTINFLFNNGGNGKQTANIEGVYVDEYMETQYTNYVEPIKPSNLVLYLQPNNNWKVDNARFAAYFFGNGETWVDMTLVEGETDIYAVTVPEGFKDIIFCRMNPNATDNNWNNKWNQTADLTVPTDGTNLYIVKNDTWDNGGGAWSTYTPAVVDPVALATPVVKAEVVGNTVTLTWDAVENAAKYGITVGTEMPVFVEEKTYVFTGEYETEYTFNVVAVPADEENFAASEAAIVTATTEAATASGPVAGSEVTVAEFLEMKDTANEFVLTGKITRVVNETYGNFDLTDATGTIYIYGLLTPEGTSQKQWAAAGLREGDTITIKGVYNEYNGSAQVKNAIYVSHVAAPFVSAEPVAINADETAATITVSANVAWTVKCDADWVTSYTTSGENDGEIVVVTTVNTLASNRTALFTISGEGVDDFVVTLTQYAAGATDTKGTYTSEDFLKSGTSTGGKYYLEKVNIGGTSYDCLKLGTSSVVGDYTTKAVGESGDLTLSFYAVGWNGKTSKLNVYVDGVKVGETLTLKSNSGAANNSPYTITPSDDTDYYSISLSGVTESSKIKFETVSGATRAIIFGVQLY